MLHFTPTLGIRDAARNTKEFIKTNMDTFWVIFKPHAPLINGLTLLDIILSVLILGEDTETGEYREFPIGGLISSYFYTCLVISWHRVVIHGVDQFEPMNPFKPKKSELAFIGMGILIGFIAVLFIILLGIPAIMTKAPSLLILVVVGFICAFYVGLRICFYFPAKATDKHVTFRHSFAMTKGLVFKLVIASILAALKMWFWMVLYAIAGLGVVFALGMAVGGTFGESATDVASASLGFLYAVPIAIYFQPILTVIGVTVLSNYYQYALQNRPSAPQKTEKVHYTHEDLNKTRQALDKESKD